MTDICIICLKNKSNLINIGNDACKIEILDKLKNCVPEVEWSLCFKICHYCKKVLFKLYSFKQTCIKSYKSLENSIECAKDSIESVTKINDIDSDSDTAALGVDLELSECEEKPPQNVEDSVHFECFECRKVFKCKLVLENHIKRNHKIGKTPKLKKKYRCEFCGKIYTTQNGIEKHLKNCNQNTTELNQDTKAENVKDDFHETKSEKGVKHQIINIEEVDLKVAPTCSDCGTTFCNKYLLKRHLQNVHATEKKFKCDMCERTFVSLVYLNAHKRYHVGDRCHICSFCGKGFITASDLYHHEKIHANKRAYRCEICPKAFNTSSDLHKHKLCVHLDRSEWKYVCTYCQRRFPLKTNLDTHIKSHTGEKNHPCHLCDRKCINKSVLMRHIETHSNVIAFKCHLCMQGYKYRKSLDIHMAKIHGIGNVKVPERIKKFFCHLCPKSYFANNKLQKHIRSHNGERPFQCSNCEKSFVDKSYIKQHLKIAHNIVNLNTSEF